MTHEQTRSEQVMAIWIVTLRELLDWSEEESRIWAAKWVPYMDDPFDLFYHQTVLYYVTGLLIPESVRSIHDIPIEPIREQLEGAIQGDGGNSVTDRAFDWDAARKRVDQILGRFGESLDNVKQNKEPR